MERIGRKNLGDRKERSAYVPHSISSTSSPALHSAPSQHRAPSGAPGLVEPTTIEPTYPNKCKSYSIRYNRIKLESYSDIAYFMVNPERIISTISDRVPTLVKSLVYCVILCEYSFSTLWRASFICSCAG